MTLRFRIIHRIKEAPIAHPATETISVEVELSDEVSVAVNKVPDQS